MTTVLVVVMAAISLHAKMWVDELDTLFIARLSGFGEIAAATMDGADGQPPLYPWLVHALLPLSLSEAFAVRLPSTVGFGAMVLALAAYARRRLPATFAIVVGLLSARLAFNYGSEGRDYGLALGFVGISLLLWSLAAEGRARCLTALLLALCVAGAVCSHYYTIFFAVCLLLAEFVRARVERKFDPLLPIVVLSAASVALAAHYPLIVALRVQLLHFWSPAYFGAIPHFYKMFLQWPALLFALAMLSAAFLPVENRGPLHSDFAPHELAANVFIALAPIGIVMLARMMSGPFVFRYALWSIIGIAILSAIVLHRFARQNAVIGVIVVLALVAGLVSHGVSAFRSGSSLRESQPILDALRTLPPGEEPIVLPDSHAFMELSSYAPADLRRRLVYPICEDQEVRYLGYDTDSLIMTGLKRWTNLNIVSCKDGLYSGRDYFIAGTPTDYLPWAGTPTDYLPWLLVSKGLTVKPLDPFSPSPKVFRVSGRASNP
jgi:hypothetical protein